ncbi:hypothetical protein [Enterococcus crotali]
MIERCSTVKSKKRKWVQLLIISCYFVYLIGMNESYAAENAKATVGFYEIKKKEQRETDALPSTGERPTDRILRISGISILLFITEMISYRILMNGREFK